MVIYQEQILFSEKRCRMEDLEPPKQYRSAFKNREGCHYLNYYTRTDLYWPLQQKTRTQPCRSTPAFPLLSVWNRFAEP